MKSKDMLQLAVRLLGLVFLYRGLTPLPTLIPMVFSGSVTNLLISVLMVGWPLLVAYWLLRGAPLILRIAYPETTKTVEPELGGVCGHKADA
ncbi:MAG: hypothetical protein KA236_01895 [Verrucomicrobia bacterium]|jgi:hypothetical protein|nr:hypothetical protein [Verrucomicrobiota bacterium]